MLMSKFNQPLTLEKRVQNHPSATINSEGGLAFHATPELELYLRVCTCLLEDKFYIKASDEKTKLIALIKQCSRNYVLRLASYARNVMNLRSIPQVLLAEASCMQAESKEPKRDVRMFARQIVKRADEPGELIAYWLGRGGTKKNFPNSLKKGLSDVMNTFDEYQLGKYNRNASVKIRDVVRLVHPKPVSDQQSALFKKVLTDTLATPETWETHISLNGASAKTWNEIAPKMGSMAILRNLRNFLQHEAKEAIEVAVKLFGDKEAIAKSKMLPFRWQSAAKELESLLSINSGANHFLCSKLVEAVHGAMDLSVVNLPILRGTTAIFVDNSASMGNKLSAKGSVSYNDVATLLGAVALHCCESALVGVFGESFSVVPLTKRDSLASNARRLAKTDVGHATYGHLVIEYLLKSKTVVDRVIILTDEECYNSNGYGYRSGGSVAGKWAEYVAQVNKNAMIYTVNLAANSGKTILPPDGKNVVQLAGWSNEFLSLIGAYEGRFSAVEHVANYTGPERLPNAPRLQAHDDGANDE